MSGNPEFHALSSSAKFKKFRRLLCEMSGLDLVFMDSEARTRDRLDYKDEIAPLCLFMRSNAAFDAACKRCDAANYAAAVKERRALCRECHAGLLDVVAPVRLNGVQAGALIGGQLFDAPATERSFSKFRSGLAPYKFDEAKLRELFFQARRMEPRRLRCAIELVELFAEHVEELGSRMLEERKGEGLAESALEIIRAEFRSPLSLDDLAQRLGVTPQHLSKILNKESGDSFCGHLTRLRVERAEVLLHSSAWSLGRIASEAGFSSIRNFNRCFRELTGGSPSRWRQLRDRSGS